MHAYIHIVLYLFIDIAPLAVHTNKKRFQCERPREKRAVLRERKEALSSPVNKVDHYIDLHGCEAYFRHFSKVQLAPGHLNDLHFTLLKEGVGSKVQGQ